MVKELSLSIAAGFVLDLIFGDPRGFPHPVRLIGKSIEALEKPLRKIKKEKIAGILLVALIVGITYFIAYYIASISIFVEIILIYTVFAVKSLAVEAKKVYACLMKEDIEGARKQVSFLVSRDTENLSEQEVVKAAIETVAENIVDGIISPMFYLFIGGAPLAMAYKAASTLDSMVGYKNDRYINFGWASARLDDLLNFIPARIAAFFLIPFAAFLCGYDYKNSFRIAVRDRHNHSSPNSAHPEAAVAGALGCQLGGPAAYFGKLTKKPFIGDKNKEIEKEDILKSITIMYAASVSGLIFGFVLLFVTTLAINICSRIHTDIHGFFYIF